MFNFLSQADIIFLLSHYGYFVFLPIDIVEGPIVTMIGGFLSSLGYLNFWIIYLLAVAGDIIGDAIYYAIGYWGGNKIIHKGKFMMISIENLKKIQKHFEKHSVKTLLFGKWGHSVGAPILLAGGMSHMSFEKFITTNFLGTLPKVLAFVSIGYYFGEAYSKINKYFSYATLSILVVGILLAIVYFVIKKSKAELNLK